MIELVGWLGFFYILLGYLLNAKQMISCFFFWGIGNIILIGYAIMINSNPQVGIAIIFLIMKLKIKDFNIYQIYYYI